ncbi:hypothetical protein HDU76_012991 [Blyttiomyces sp. JEL0837]|nr:hypothetical protein HDU76_012991 [Blyttiomyces sp. JEL0837]
MNSEEAETLDVTSDEKGSPNIFNSVSVKSDKVMLEILVQTPTDNSAMASANLTSADEDANHHVQLMDLNDIESPYTKIPDTPKTEVTTSPVVLQATTIITTVALQDATLTSAQTPISLSPSPYQPFFTFADLPQQRIALKYDEDDDISVRSPPPPPQPQPRRQAKPTSSIRPLSGAFETSSFDYSFQMQPQPQRPRSAVFSYDVFANDLKGDSDDRTGWGRPTGVIGEISIPTGVANMSDGDAQSVSSSLLQRAATVGDGAGVGTGGAPAGTSAVAGTSTMTARPRPLSSLFSFSMADTFSVTGGSVAHSIGSSTGTQPHIHADIQRSTPSVTRPSSLVLSNAGGDVGHILPSHEFTGSGVGSHSHSRKSSINAGSVVLSPPAGKHQYPAAGSILKVLRPDGIVRAHAKLEEEIKRENELRQIEASLEVLVELFGEMRDILDAQEPMLDTIDTIADDVIQEVDTTNALVTEALNGNFGPPPTNVETSNYQSISKDKISKPSSQSRHNSIYESLPRPWTPANSANTTAKPPKKSITTTFKESRRRLLESLWGSNNVLKRWQNPYPSPTSMKTGPSNSGIDNPTSTRRRCKSGAFLSRSGSRNNYSDRASVTDIGDRRPRQADENDRGNHRNGSPIVGEWSNIEFDEKLTREENGTSPTNDVLGDSNTSIAKKDGRTTRRISLRAIVVVSIIIVLALGAVVGAIVDIYVVKWVHL